jgi:hypothetical protein
MTKVILFYVEALVSFFSLHNAFSICFGTSPPQFT